tara:strand:+ start:22 stop:555 length:534 start_codon:yes stop_codon:yes gene_type:complete
MAKRGYRGKHPHNDMKVSKHSASTSKRNPKLQAEYDKLHPKQKYSYIRDQQGFFPTGELIISGTADLVAASQITMSSTVGAVLSMKGIADDTNTSNRVFKSDGTAAQASNGIRDIVNVNMAGKLTASVASDIVTITQEEPGPDGNTAVILNAENVAQGVTFNSIGANNSGSLNFIGG